MPPSDEALQALRRGKVVVINLDPARGSEQGKTRPAVIVSADIYNRNIDTIVIIPISGLKDDSGVKRERRLDEVVITTPQAESGLDFDSVAQPIQVRTIDRYERVTRIIGTLQPKDMQSISLKLAEVVCLG